MMAGHRHNNRDANESDLISELQQVGLDVYRVKSDTAGVPDLLIGYGEDWWLVEIKTDGGKLSTTQEQFIEHHTYYNRRVCVARTARDVLRYIGALIE
jgi:Holliday junction resolvase